MSNTSWGGRFEQSLEPLALEYSASVDVDKRLAHQDIQGSIGHVRMLKAQGIIAAADASEIENGLLTIEKKIASGEFSWSQALEDVHMNIEQALTKLIGEAGGRLHTARSRNDQVATDLRLWTREACEAIIAAIDGALTVIAERAENGIHILMPGFTHLQRAQPVRLAHHLLAWSEMLERDRGRFVDAKTRLNECPLGAGALATTTFPIDRAMTAKSLGFDRPMANSLDAVSDRDFLLEVASASAICAVHLSRIGEELVLWSSQEFGFVEMSDAFATGSSIMPQKKNPDMAELMRGKSARVIGDLMSLLTLVKGLPLSYNRDLQEDKEPIFDACDTVLLSLKVLSAMLGTLKFNEEAMRNATRDGFLNATEVADYLAQKGVPFREAHHITGRLVKSAALKHKTLEELSLEEFRAENTLFDESIFAVLDMNTAVERRAVVGGPSTAEVSIHIRELRARLSERASKKQA